MVNYNFLYTAPNKEEALKGIRAIAEVYMDFLLNPDKAEHGNYTYI